MDQELFIIEVLSAKQKLSRKRKRAKRIMFKLLSLVFFSGLLFRAVSFLYRHMSAVVRSAEGMQN